MLVLLNKFIKFFLSVILIIFVTSSVYSEEKKIDFIETNWSFNGIFGTFDRASLQRGYQVYQEVCAGCHSVQHLSYRNLFEEGGPEFSKEEAKAIASQFEIEDGPNSDGEMFMRPARLSDNFVKPFLTSRLLQLLTVEHTLLICPFLLKLEQVEQIISILFF